MSSNRRMWLVVVYGYDLIFAFAALAYILVQWALLSDNVGPVMEAIGLIGIFGSLTLFFALYKLAGELELWR